MKILSEKIEVTEENYLIVAAKHYQNPQCTSTEEFYDDLNRVKYIKRLINRYFDTQEISERLIINHIIVFYNVFGIEIATKLLAVKLEHKYWTVIKCFLVKLNYLTSSDLAGIHMDKKVVEALRKI
tara:strand:+ start:227 stop:604 length:378 start_codon:yes stop_codon:yes gene_type:complete